MRLLQVHEYMRYLEGGAQTLEDPSEGLLGEKLRQTWRWSARLH